MVQTEPLHQPLRYSRPSAFHTIVVGGLLIGVLDMFDALFFFGWYLGIGTQRVFQSVAAGILGGEAAAAGGWNTFALGLLLHYVVAFGAASVFYLLSRYISVLWRYPFVSGPLFGIAAHLFMQFAVIPFSAIGRWPTFTLGTSLNGFIGHAVLVGLPVALVAARSAKNRSDKS